jgi:hypothetical protein
VIKKSEKGYEECFGNTFKRHNIELLALKDPGSGRNLCEL